MPDRILLDGTRVKEAAHVRPMTINTRVPGKWAVVDLETGQVWVHAAGGGWEEADAAVKRVVEAAAIGEQPARPSRTSGTRRRDAAKA